MTFEGKKVTEEVLEKIGNLNGAGLTNRQIAKLVNLHHNTVGYHLKKLSLEANGSARFGLDRVDETRSRCRICKLVKSNIAFTVNRKGDKREYTLSACNECRYIQARIAKNKNILSFFKEKVVRLRARAKQDNIHFDLDAVDLLDAYEDQNGLCYYTGVKLIAQVGNGIHKHSLSVDRIVPENGYTKHNTVLCTHQANTIKSNMTLDELRQWIPAWYNKLVREGFIESDIPFFKYQP